MRTHTETVATIVQLRATAGRRNVVAPDEADLADCLKGGAAVLWLLAPHGAGCGVGR